MAVSPPPQSAPSLVPGWIAVCVFCVFCVVCVFSPDPAVLWPRHVRERRSLQIEHMTGPPAHDGDQHAPPTGASGPPD
eukprot:15449808-Alexandrium_andersonii.AAC.1